VSYATLLGQAKADGIVTSTADAKVLAFCLDNLFLTLQFSLSTEYWRDRMKVYLGDDITEREEHLKSQISIVIRGALGIRE
jgi:hypothetical protein